MDREVLRQVVGPQFTVNSTLGTAGSQSEELCERVHPGDIVHFPLGANGVSCSLPWWSFS